MQVSLLGLYIRTRNMFTLQRGVRHDQLVLVIWRSLRRGERPQKLWGLTGVGAGQNLLIFIDCLSPFLGVARWETLIL